VIAVVPNRSLFLCAANRRCGIGMAHYLVHAKPKPEEDYCSPPLVQERAAVLDLYFDEITVERVDAGTGWEYREAAETGSQYMNASGRIETGLKGQSSSANPAKERAVHRPGPTSAHVPPVSARKPNRQSASYTADRKEAVPSTLP
jgi:hypothetical protein